MEFGPEIKVDGVRPEWLDPCEPFEAFTGRNWITGSNRERFTDLEWTCLMAIRLPANHPHYNLITHTYTVRPEDEAALLASDPLSRSTPTPDERAVAPGLVSRLVELAERLANQSMGPWPCQDEARAILAALEPVVDPDIQLIAEAMARVDSQDWSDVHEISRKYYLKYAKAIRGRQLEKEGK